MKSKGTLAVVAVAMLIIGGVIGAVAWKEYGQEEPTTQFVSDEDEGVTRVATLDYTIDDSSFANFSSEVDVNGSVSADADKTANITIYNNDTDDSAPLTMHLVNSINGREGLPTAIQLDDVTVSVAVQTNTFTKTYNLFGGSGQEGDFRANGVDLGVVESNAHGDLEITVTVESCDDNTFNDGETYNCELYFMQGSTSYDEVEWTFTT